MMVELLLSEAIKKGAAMGPKACGRMFSTDGGSCALGAAIQGATGKRIGSYTKAQHLFPILRRRTRHPTHPFAMAIEDIILDLNDHQDWSRERIAEWVSTIESATLSTPEASTSS